MASNMSFATLQEAWGVPAFGVQPVEPEAKKPETQRDVLEKSESSHKSWLFVTNYIRQMHAERGAAAVLGLMDPKLVREMRMQTIMSFEWLDAEAMLMGFLFVCALWLMGDALRRPR